MADVSKCIKCSTLNEVKIASGHNKPENKDRKYFNCINPQCKWFQWVEGGQIESVGPSEDVEQEIFRKEDDDEVEGKVRHGVTLEAMKLMGALVPINSEMKDIIDGYTHFIITGELPERK